MKIEGSLSFARKGGSWMGLMIALVIGVSINLRNSYTEVCRSSSSCLLFCYYGGHRRMERLTR